MVATSAGFSSLSETGKPRKSVDLPVAVTVSESIARNSTRMRQGKSDPFLL
jgi:hypothetical protein